MEITDQEQYGFDWDWFAADDLGYIGHFASAGMRALPRSVKRDKEAAEALIEHFQQTAERRGEGAVRDGLEQDAPDLPDDKARRRYLEGFLEMAGKGLFSFDTDSHMEEGAGYFLVATPSRPLMLGDLPPETRALLEKTRARGVVFQQATRIAEEATLTW